MIIVRKNKYANSLTAVKKKKGFFGNLWNKIKKNIGAIIGFVAAGPVGAAIGELIQSWLTVNPDIVVTTGKTNLDLDLDVDAINEDSYPISQTEENFLFKWLDKEFKPTILNIANSVDQKIQLTFSKVANNTVNEITVINQALRQLSILKAYALHIEQYGYYHKNFLETIKLSDNYVINKVEAMFIVLDQVEKGIIKYMVEKGFTGYELIAQSEDITNVTKVERVNIDWQGQKIQANIKQYADASLISDDQVIDVDNVNLSDSTPATSTDTEVINTEGEPKPTNNKAIKVIGVTSALLLLRKAFKANKNK